MGAQIIQVVIGLATSTAVLWQPSPLALSRQAAGAARREGFMASLLGLAAQPAWFNARVA
jgi:hypothetical protein